jgi:hypothetical protein|tara:strand:+ start:2370 stop:2564 length:195 start_codon:yes stop_codon:yes gene_type:complete
MTRSGIVQLVKEVMTELDEANVTNVGGATMTPGNGPVYGSPNAFSRTPSKRAKETLTKQGYKEV